MAANTNHPELLQPDNNIFVWKYLSLEQFLYLITNNMLWFSRLDKLGDSFEGTTPLKQKNCFKVTNNTNEKMTLKESVLDNLIRYQRVALFVNCWHANNNESMAMWKIYGKTDLSLAIKIKYSTLVSLLPESVIIGKVKYQNYDKYKEMNNVLAYATTKREAFIYENEIRALFYNTKQLPNIITDLGFELTNINDIPFGHNIKINRSELLETIVLNPYFPDWFISTFKNICLKYNINQNCIIHSDLDTRKTVLKN